MPLFLQPLSVWLDEAAGLAPGMQEKLLTSLVIVAVVWALHRIVAALAFWRVRDLKRRYRVRKSSRYIALGVALILLGRVWFNDVRALATYLGLLSAGLAIALQTLILNLAGWAFILLRRPFSVGDRIEIGGTRGDVVDVRLFEFTLLEIGNWVDADQSTGRVIYVPNGAVFREPLANYTGGFRYIWVEIPVLVTFESNWREAKRALLEIGRRHTSDVAGDAARRVAEANRRFLISYTHLEPTVYTSVRESGVLLTLRCLVSPRARRMLEQRIWEDILDRFAQADDLDLAYPTWRVYTRPAEGRPMGPHRPAGPPPES